MAEPTLPSDPLWPRAAAWLADGSAAPQGSLDLAVLGVPTHRTSISPTGAHTTPSAIRDALLRYSTYAEGADLASLRVVDLGDVDHPDGPAGEQRVASAIEPAQDSTLLLVLGGDNSLTYSVMRGLAGGDLGAWGLVTVDAHHDLRDGESNGSPVRRLLDAGLPGDHVVQIGIADFSNSPEYTQRAAEAGVTVVRRAELRGRDLGAVVSEALDTASPDGRPVYVDLDVDVCDRSVVPACPAAAPGGLAADELRQLARAFAADRRVRAIDIVEIDASVDTHDQRTVRLGALLVLEIAAGLAAHRGHGLT